MTSTATSRYMVRRKLVDYQGWLREFGGRVCTFEVFPTCLDRGPFIDPEAALFHKETP